MRKSKASLHQSAGSSPSRASVTDAQTNPQKTFAPKSEQFTGLMDPNFELLRDAEFFCKLKLDRFLPFALNNDSFTESTTAWKQRAAVGNTLDDINELRPAAKNQLREKYLLLYQHTASFGLAVMQLPNGYAGGNLLSLTKSELTMTLQNLEIRDANHFADYCIRIIEGSMGQEQSWEERNQFRGLSDQDAANSNLFLDKAFMLLRQLLNRSLYRETLLALVLFRSLHHKDSYRVKELSQARAHTRIDKAIVRLVGDGVRPDWYLRPVTRAGVTEYRCAFRVVTPYPDPKVPRRVFWDFANASRILRETYDMRTCEGLQSYDLKSPPCFHQTSVDLLGLLQEKAWGEIRFKVRLMSGYSLPAELFEQVFEAALEVEEVPLNPLVYDTTIQDLSSRNEQSTASTGRQPRQPWLYEHIKQVYLCERMEDPDVSECLSDGISGYDARLIPEDNDTLTLEGTSVHDHHTHFQDSEEVAHE